MSMKKKIYEAPLFEVKRVELEKGFMKASVFEDGKENAEGVTIEQHGFAEPEKAWEGNYTTEGWE